jgi:predicted dehydrogenase
MEPLRIGVLGAARIAGRAIAAPARLTGARIVAVAARDRSRAEAFAAAHDVERVLGSYAELLADPEVEAVYNPLANGLHGPWNLAAVAAGRHVLSEKPFASDAEEAEEVRSAAEQAMVVAAEGFHWYYHPLAERLLELLTSGELGELARVEATVNIPAPAPDDPRWSLALAGGALMDLGCYGLHAHRVLAPWGGGEPELVRASGRERAGAPGVDEWAEVELAFPSGARTAWPAATWPARPSSSPCASPAPGARRTHPASWPPSTTTGCWSGPVPVSTSSASAPVPPTPTSSKRSRRPCATAPRCRPTPTTPSPPCT